MFKIPTQKLISKITNHLTSIGIHPKDISHNQRWEGDGVFELSASSIEWYLWVNGSDNTDHFDGGVSFVHIGGPGGRDEIIEVKDLDHLTHLLKKNKFV